MMKRANGGQFGNGANEEASLGYIRKYLRRGGGDEDFKDGEGERLGIFSIKTYLVGTLYVVALSR